MNKHGCLHSHQFQSNSSLYQNQSKLEGTTQPIPQKPSLEKAGLKQPFHKYDAVLQSISFKQKTQTPNEKNLSTKLGVKGEKNEENIFLPDNQIFQHDVKNTLMQQPLQMNDKMESIEQLNQRNSKARIPYSLVHLSQNVLSPSQSQSIDAKNIPSVQENRNLIQAIKSTNNQNIFRLRQVPSLYSQKFSQMSKEIKVQTDLLDVSKNDITPKIQIEQIITNIYDIRKNLEALSCKNQQVSQEKGNIQQMPLAIAEKAQEIHLKSNSQLIKNNAPPNFQIQKSCVSLLMKQSQKISNSRKHEYVSLHERKSQNYEDDDSRSLRSRLQISSSRCSTQRDIPQRNLSEDCPVNQITKDQQNKDSPSKKNKAIPRRLEVSDQFLNILEEEDEFFSSQKKFQFHGKIAQKRDNQTINKVSQHLVDQRKEERNKTPKNLIKRSQISKIFKNILESSDQTLIHEENNSQLVSQNDIILQNQDSTSNNNNPQCKKEEKRNNSFIFRKNNLILQEKIDTIIAENNSKEVKEVINTEQADTHLSQNIESKNNIKPQMPALCHNQSQPLISIQNEKQQIQQVQKRSIQSQQGCSTNGGKNLSRLLQKQSPSKRQGTPKRCEISRTIKSSHFNIKKSQISLNLDTNIAYEVAIMNIGSPFKTKGSLFTGDISTAAQTTKERIKNKFHYDDRSKAHKEFIQCFFISPSRP